MATSSTANQISSYKESSIVLPWRHDVLSHCLFLLQCHNINLQLWHHNEKDLHSVYQWTQKLVYLQAQKVWLFSKSHTFIHSPKTYTGSQTLRNASPQIMKSHWHLGMSLFSNKTTWLYIMFLPLLLKLHPSDASEWPTHNHICRGQENSIMVSVYVCQLGRPGLSLAWSICFRMVEFSQNIINLPHQCWRLVQQRPFHLLSCQCDDTCKRSLAFCRKRWASFPVLLSVPKWSTCAEQGRSYVA